MEVVSGENPPCFLWKNSETLNIAMEQIYYEERVTLQISREDENTCFLLCCTILNYKCHSNDPVDRLEYFSPNFPI